MSFNPFNQNKPPDIYAPKFEGFKSPGGDYHNSGGYNIYNPKSTKIERKTRRAEDKGIFNSVKMLTKPLDVNTMYNNPFYDSTYSMFSRPIQQQQQQDQKSLLDNLNARNQIGGSYDAYQNNLLNQRYDQQYGQARDQARSASANAYQQQYSNALQTLAGLTGSKSTAFTNSYLPLQFGMQSQQMLNGAQSNAAQIGLQQQQMQQQQQQDMQRLAMMFAGGG